MILGYVGYICHTPPFSTRFPTCDFVWRIKRKIIESYVIQKNKPPMGSNAQLVSGSEFFVGICLRFLGEMSGSLSGEIFWSQFFTGGVIFLWGMYKGMFGENFPGVNF